MVRRQPWAAWLCHSLAVCPVYGQRETISLDGPWRIADSKSADEMPATFEHTVPVPGLANLAQPPFAAVDQFYSREQLANRIRAKLSPPEWLTEYPHGKVDWWNLTPVRKSC